MKADVTTFAQRCESLPSLPAVCLELAEVIDQPDSSVEDITKVLHKDQSMAARLLKLANSVFYGFPCSVGTLEQAVQLIGLNEVREMVVATTAIDSFDRVPAHLVNVSAFWEHSIACGIASSLIASERNEPDTGRYFVGGLLHDIGRLVMFLAAPEESAVVLQRCEKEEDLATNIEKQVFGFDHASLGAELLSMWNLPRPLVQMVRHHHNPSGAATALFDAFIIHYADFIISTLGIGQSGELFVAPFVVPPKLKNALFNDERLAGMMAEFDRQFTAMVPILTGSQG